eukprot:gene15100-20318_t
MIYSFNDTTTSIKLWVDSYNLSSWYSPSDLCMIYSNISTNEDQLMKECDTVHKNKNAPGNVPLRCRIGNTWPSRSSFCSSYDLPFINRTHFRKVVHGYDDPTTKPLESFFLKLGLEHGALLLIGDSVMQQFFNAIACELEREQIWNNPSKFTNTDEIQHVKINVNNSQTHFPSNHKVVNSVPIKFLPLYHFVNGKYDRVANASMNSLKHNIEQYISLHSSLVIVLNMGLHYINNPEAHFTRADYQQQMTVALQYLDHMAVANPMKNIKIFFRETSAQHFPTPNGYWPGQRYSSNLKLGCVPIQDPSPEADWRNRDIEQIIITHKLYKIQILRFYNITVPLWSEHPNGQLKDCTHFCWSPMLYQPLFHQLNIVLQKDILL